ncbi:MAG: aspartyl protease family protein [Bryobacteraceae bacterium]|jgi:predicted aspartyl protease
MRQATVFGFLLAVWQCIGSGQPSAGVTSSYEAHRWFELRDAVVDAKAPTFYRGIVASAFNQAREAEKRFRSVIRIAPESEQAYAARAQLVYLHWRAGRNREALAELDEMLRAKPDAADAKKFRGLFAAMSRYPKQSLTERHFSRMRYRMTGGNLFIPVSIDGRSTNLVFDTGANFSAISTSEAERLGLAVNTGGAKGLSDSGGAKFEVHHVAFAAELAVGNVRMRNVAFLVLPDERFADIPAGDRGILGLPVILAFETVRWKADGTFEIGFRPATRHIRKSNLCFEGAMPIVQMGFRNCKIDMLLDTGAVGTGLYPRFQEEFGSIVNGSGNRGSTRSVGAGGSTEIDVITLPELVLQLGGFTSALRPARVLLKDVGFPWQHGCLGMDFLSQARVVTLDFKSMTLDLE